MRARVSQKRVMLAARHGVPGVRRIESAWWTRVRDLKDVRIF
jgi:hypothetical protein